MGSGNTYADLGFEEPELERVKAGLARQVGAVIEARGLTQAQAAGILGVGPLKVSALLHGRLGGCSVERLVRLSAQLDQA